MGRILEGIFEKNLKGLQRAMDLTLRRNQAITSNIANAETPQYRAIDMDFSRELERAFSQSSGEALQRTNPKHIGTVEGSSAHLVADLSGATKADGNNVDIDVQMGRLAYNSGQYSVAANLLRRQIQIIKMAVREGAR